MALPLTVLLTVTLAAQTAAPSFVPTVGLESELSVSIPGRAVEVVDVDRQQPLRLAIVEQHAVGDATVCRIRYRGLRPGVFDVAAYLRRVDGSTSVAIPPILVDVVPVLRPGELIDVPMVPYPVSGDSPTARAWPWIVGGVWSNLLPLGWWWYRRSRAARAARVVPAAGSDPAGVLRPLAALAIENRLSVEGWARLERALLSYWQRRLGWAGREGPELLRMLLEHSDAGPPIRAVRGWLHERDDTAYASAIELLRRHACEEAS